MAREYINWMLTGYEDELIQKSNRAANKIEVFISIYYFFVEQTNDAVDPADVL